MCVCVCVYTCACACVYLSVCVRTATAAATPSSPSSLSDLNVSENPSLGPSAVSAAVAASSSAPDSTPLFPSLRFLSLSGCSLGDEGVTAVLPLLSSFTAGLHTLGLASNCVSCSSCPALASLAQSVQHLNLFDNLISDEGAIARVFLENGVSWLPCACALGC